MSSDSKVQPPLELELKIWKELDLVGLIKASCVCSRWRNIIPTLGGTEDSEYKSVTQNGCNSQPSLLGISPARIALLQLYQDTISSPTFISNREIYLPYLLSFDREAYIRKISAYLAAVDGRIPEEFKIWILEWPSAACGPYWPGLASQVRVPKYGCSPLRAVDVLSLPDPEPGRGNQRRHFSGPIVTALTVRSGTHSVQDDSEEASSSNQPGITLYCLRLWAVGNGTMVTEALVVGSKVEGSQSSKFSGYVTTGGKGAKGKHRMSSDSWSSYLWDTLNL